MTWAIKVEGLGKRYRLGAAHPQSMLLADKLGAMMRHPVRSIRRALANHPDETFWALRELDLEVAQGEVLGVVGRNGAGKSTLLKILSRITDPTAGRARVRGRLASLLEVGTGFHPELSGRENIYLNATILGMRRREIDRKFDEIVSFSGVERFLDTPVKHYSSGMYVRLAFAVAAHVEAEVLLIDEVLAVGDMEFQARSIGRMGEVARGGRTVLFVSHALDSVRRLCPRSIWLDAGRLRLAGDTATVLERYATAEPSAGVGAAAASDHDGAVKVLAVRVEGSRIENDALAPERSTSIELSYDVVRSVSGRLAIAIVDGWGQTVLSSASTDSGTALNETFGTGTQRAVCTVPAHLLVPGIYSITVAVPDDGGTSRIHERAAAFRVGKLGSLIERDGRRGAVAPLLQWQMEQVGGPTRA